MENVKSTEVYNLVFCFTVRERIAYETKHNGYNILRNVMYSCFAFPCE